METFAPSVCSTARIQATIPVKKRQTTPTVQQSLIVEFIIVTRNWLLVAYHCE